MVKRIIGLLNPDPREQKNMVFPLVLFLLIPPLVSIMFGVQYTEKSVGHVPTAVLDYDHSNLSNSLVNEFKANDNFEVKYFIDNEQVLKELLRDGKVAAGVVIPGNFSQDLLNGKGPRVLAIYDGSQMAMAGSAKGKFSEILATVRGGYLLKIMEGKAGIMPEAAPKYVQPFSFTTRTLGNSAKSYVNYYIQGMIINVIQVGLVILALEMGRSKRENFKSLWTKGVILGGLGIAQTVVSLGIQIFVFSTPYHGSIAAGFVLTALFCIGMASLGLLASVLIRDQRTVIYYLPTLVTATLLFSGYTFPLISMPAAFNSIASVMPFLYYGETMRRLSLLGLDFNHVIPQMLWLGKFVLLIWAVLLAACIWKKHNLTPSLQEKEGSPA